MDLIAVQTQSQRYAGSLLSKNKEEKKSREKQMEKEVRIKMSKSKQIMKNSFEIHRRYIQRVQIVIEMDFGCAKITSGKRIKNSKERKKKNNNNIVNNISHVIIKASKMI